MDAKKLGAFIAQVRKENHMTQLELARKLQVTDKAVSKWERGLGFPDINTMEPLAEALGVSVLELMQSRRITTAVAPGAADAALTDTFALAKAQRQTFRHRLLLAGAVFLLAAAGLGLFHWLRWAGALAGQTYDTRQVWLLQFGLIPLYLAGLGSFGAAVLRTAAHLTLPKQAALGLAALGAALAAVYLAAVVPGLLPGALRLQIMALRYPLAAGAGALVTFGLQRPGSSS